ncbi:hypothetical protein [Paenibacillus senegalensis]|uniref:hypothetical protein n=1 Tax=Paenibacillus senegalensis TaxID=1465766 RepID=UPI0002884AA4|nr:hypothetical protein [Paenibacillus senegalensis]
MEQPITFHFDTAQAAEQAADTLQELGYKTKTALDIYIGRGDLTSALEIAQAYGGEISVSSHLNGHILDGGHKPAGDGEVAWHENHAFESRQPSDQIHAYTDEEDKWFDPSEEDYNQFSAGIHL